MDTTDHKNENSTADSEVSGAINWTIMSILIIGAFMAILDSSIVNVAIPKMMAVFSAGTSDIEWVLTGYMLVLGIVVPVTGYLGDRFGYKRMYMVSLTIFTIGSALCGLAWSTWTMVGFRVIQGIGGGMIMPLTMSMVYRVVPRNKIGLALGVWGIAALAAPAIGPTIGGYMVDYLNWRLIYSVNIPIGIIAVILCSFYLAETPLNTDLKFDFNGFMFSAVGLFCLLLALSEGTDRGWTSDFILSLFVIATVTLIYFVLHELRTTDPMLDLRLLKHPTFTGSILITSITSIAMFGGVFLVPLYMQNFRGFSAMQTGELMMPAGFATGLIMPISGRLYDKIGAKPLIVVGLVVLGLATLLFHNLTMETAYGTIMLWLIIRSVGLGLCMMPATNAGMSVVPTKLVGRASSLNNVIRQVSSSFGVAIITTLLTGRETFHQVTGADAITPDNFQMVQAVNLMQNMMLRAGLGLDQAKAAALTMVNGMLMQKAFVQAVADVFLVLAVVAFAGLIPVLLLRREKQADAEL